ncbi:MAG: hypothetical protein QOI55_93, partial [Actinomycetota bacterium]|nr:hypothetical protein [Actinomycetota bacterium]
MRRRILFATLTVAALAVVLFALPLAVTVRNLVIADELGELEHLATRAERGVTSASLRGVDPAEFPRSERGTRFGLYDLSGVRRAGKGPQHLEFGLRTVLSGRVAQHRGHRLAVVVPVTGDEHVAAIVRVDAPASETAGRVARAWLLIAACAAAALAIAAILASTQARRIAAPLGRLAQAANRVGAGDRTTSAPRSGVAEIDDIAAALDLAGKRVDDALTRERQFTADASHQLRTPLTALRVALENEVRNANGDRASLETAIAQTDRLEATIDELLALARDTHAVSAPLDLDGLFADVREQWHGPLAAAGRPLRLAHDTDVEPVRASTIAVRQIIDVLVANAVEHGAGAI